ncbi:hypothetical protein [Brevibacillus laterosporus]|uniref:hypothetical protein n=1 Tax=Brevibacillus laterosporus TaxID=1465 RepID=UPI0019576FAE|nr:hypothetical protein [Brevibacillus laterosporus]MBM7109719.1 EAL domain protein [Brevibacillus laterosporus]
MKLLPHYQAIVDMVDHKIIGYEATIKGIRGKEEIGAVQLFEEAQYQDNTTQLDFEARKVSLKNGLPFLQYQERLFLNMVPDSLYLPDSWFPVRTPIHQITLEITEQAPILTNNDLIQNL